MENALLTEIIDGWNIRIASLGMTRKKFCDVTGVSYSTYCQLTKCNPTIRLLDKIERKIQSLEISA